MTKAELIDRIARSRDLPPDITKKVVGEVLELAFAELGQYFVRGKLTRNGSPKFTFPKFGTFTKKKRSARRGVNPRTLEPMEIDACDTIDFKPSVELKRQMNEARSASLRESGEPALTSARKPAKPKAAKPAKPKAAKPALASGPGRRKLVTRDEAELELGGGEVLLPEPPLQKVRRKAPTGAGKAEAGKPKTRRRAG
jgi:DNA-binding protein HU-beta